MKPETKEWVSKAEGDFYDVLRGIRARKHPNYDSVCFHAQQCIEKYLKAYLVEAKVSFPKTHDLSRILDVVTSLEPMWETWRADLDLLTSFAVEYRYPGESATREDARRAHGICRTLRTHLRDSLSLRDARG
ncbi:MAG TPA: HEPN domain-containing protein [Opitutaceae bacterium]|jgi:HEPN domain-containing protein|nr:HEPN domain-containing protein [Opitutaceae bacterium]